MKYFRLALPVFASAALTLTATTSSADTAEELADRTSQAADVIAATVIPLSLMQKAECVATFPNTIRLGLVFGARFGEGLVACRVPGGWSTPVYLDLAGGSWGVQFGFQKVDLVLVFLSHQSLGRLANGNFVIGVDASVAAGPVGRDASVGTDIKEVYSYSRVQGLFAGLTIGGTSIRPDWRDNARVYGSETSLEAILTTQAVLSPYAEELNRISQ